MKFKDLTKEEQEHFKKVVEYCNKYNLEDQLIGATHIRPNSLSFALIMHMEGVEFYYDSLVDYTWKETDGTTNKGLYQKPEDYLTLLTGTNQMTTKESKVTVQELKEETFKPLKITLEILKEEDLLALKAVLTLSDDLVVKSVNQDFAVTKETKDNFIKSLKSSTILDELLYVLETYNN